MQGPEQGLVGESRSGSPTGQAEEAKPGERGVGEIAELTELRRHIVRAREEAREKLGDQYWAMSTPRTAFWNGQATALGNILEYVDRITEKRSDLSNAGSMAAGADGTPLTVKEKS